MDSAELSEWLAFDAAYGLPDVYFQTAQVTSATHAAMSGKRGKADWYVPFFREQVRKLRQTAADQIAALKAMFPAMIVVDKRNGGNR